MKQYRPKNRAMANKGQQFEKEIIAINEFYESKEIALIQKISTPWKVVRSGDKIISAFPEKKSTLDFRGTVKGGIPVSFDCKETRDQTGLPLADIADHQIDFIRKALKMGEVSFILCRMLENQKNYIIPGITVIQYWDTWQQNKRRKGYNKILIADMNEVEGNNNIRVNYLKGMYEDGN